MTETILVVDDEQSIRHAIKRCFPQYTVLEAESAEGGLEQARDGFPDLVLLDQYLPDGDGLELIKSLHAIDAELPIILMTGSGSVDMAVEALKQGANDFLEKPMDLLDSLFRNLSKSLPPNSERHSQKRKHQQIKCFSPKKPMLY